MMPSERGKRYGRALAEACLQHLERVGIPRTTIHLFGDHDEGKAFWNSTHWRERSDLAAFQFSPHLPATPSLSH
ncbi:MAG: hypothetical protein J6386_06560 [Candidatus Synoicihabitans palmerolidicus]|nr:hypothetical protein [Candidatus Synoicihabitans palmerolidicus]